MQRFIDAVLCAIILVMCTAAQEPYYHLIANTITDAQTLRVQIATTANTFNVVAGAL